MTDFTRKPRGAATPCALKRPRQRVAVTPHRTAPAVGPQPRRTCLPPHLTLFGEWNRDRARPPCQTASPERILAVDLLGVALIIGIARGITVIMNNGQITDTVLHWAEVALGDVGQAAFAVVMYLLFLPLSFLIPSSSGLATVAMPIMAPLASFAAVPPELGVEGMDAARAGAANRRDLFRFGSAAPEPQPGVEGGQGAPRPAGGRRGTPAAPPPAASAH